MKNKILILILFCLSNIYAISQKEADSFITALLHNSQNINNFIDKAYLKSSNRFKISYESVRSKALISYDIADVLKNKIKREKIKYEVKIIKIDSQYDKLSFYVDKLDYSKHFYFKKGKMISPLDFYSKNWKEKDSKYFNFKISNNELFHTKNIDALDDFTANLIDILQISKQKEKLLRKEKINYIFCEDNEEIKRLTGFDTRGIFILADDTIVTTFSSHFHEIVHFMVNYKLESLGLFTNPLLLEGTAVALGGRGGKNSKTILDMGFFLEINNFLSYSDILSKENFYNYNSSLTYPTAGFYVNFLIKEIGIERFLNLYENYNFSKPPNKVIKIGELPPEGDFKRFLQDYDSMNEICEIDNLQGKKLTAEPNLKIYEAKEFYYFETSEKFLTFPLNYSKKASYESKIFKKIFPEKKYKGEEFLLKISNNEINLYNCFTNNLIASTSKGFSNKELIFFENGFYKFKILKRLLENF